MHDISGKYNPAQPQIVSNPKISGLCNYRMLIFGEIVLVANDRNESAVYVVQEEVKLLGLLKYWLHSS